MPDDIDNGSGVSTTISDSGLRGQNSRYAVASIILVIAILLLGAVEEWWTITAIDESFTTTLIAVVGFIGTAYAAMLAKEMEKEGGVITNLEVIIVVVITIMYGLTLMVSLQSTDYIEPFNPLVFPITTIFTSLVGLFFNTLRLRSKT